MYSGGQCKRTEHVGELLELLTVRVLNPTSSSWFSSGRHGNIQDGRNVALKNVVVQKTALDVFRSRFVDHFSVFSSRWQLKVPPVTLKDAASFADVPHMFL